MALTDKERALIPALLSVAQKLEAEDLEHVIWMGEGMVLLQERLNKKEIEAIYAKSEN
ncbi:MAG: hypothetical protein MJZ37_08135 [Bacilli bacterium]|nr:hypothetical protein [Bacilli bacterium]